MRSLLTGIALLLALWALVSGLHHPAPVQVDTPLTLDFADPGTGGGRAFYQLCRKMWAGTNRMAWEDHWEGNDLVVASTARMPQSVLDRLLTWVKDGHTAVLIIFQDESFLQSVSGSPKHWVPQFIGPVGEPELQRSPDGPVLLYPGQKTGSIWSLEVLGKGHLLVLADPWILSNDGLDQGQNAALAQSLVGRAATFLDSGSDDRWESLLIRDPWLRRALVPAVVLLLLMAWNQQTGWGRKRGAQEPGPRSLMEFVDGAAYLYQKHRAIGPILEAFRRGCRLRLSREHPEQASLAELLQAVVPEGQQRQDLLELARRLENPECQAREALPLMQALQNKLTEVGL